MPTLLFNILVYPPMCGFVDLSHSLFRSLAYLYADVLQRTAIAEEGEGATGRSEWMTEDAGLGELPKVKPYCYIYSIK